MKLFKFDNKFVGDRNFVCRSCYSPLNPATIDNHGVSVCEYCGSAWVVGEFYERKETRTEPSSWSRNWPSSGSRTL